MALVLIIGTAAGFVAFRGISDRNDRAAERDAKMDERISRMQAIFPDLESESDAEVTRQADVLCDMIREAGSFELWVKGVSLGAAMAGSAEGSELMGTTMAVTKGMQVAMPWRCPEYYDDAEDYIASFE